MQTHEAPDHHLIAAASSSNDNTNIIMLWKKLIKAQNSGNPTWGTIWTVLQVTMQLLAIAMVGVFLYHTMVSTLALMYPCWHMKKAPCTHQEEKVDGLWSILEFLLDENVILQVLAQELAAKFSMENKVEFFDPLTRKNECREEPLVSEVHHDVNEENSVPFSITSTTDVEIRGDDHYYVSISV